jgi:predicted DNA-binding transcriptional regulator AlpA
MIGMEIKTNPENLITSSQIRKLLGGISRQSFWNLKSRKDFPTSAYKAGRAELWHEKDIREYIENRKEKELKNENK